MADEKKDPVAMNDEELDIVAGGVGGNWQYFYSEEEQTLTDGSVVKGYRIQAVEEDTGTLKQDQFYAKEEFDGPHGLRREIILQGGKLRQGSIIPQGQ